MNKEEFIEQIVNKEMSRILWEIAIPDISDAERAFIRGRMVETISEAINKWESEEKRNLDFENESENDVCQTCNGEGVVSAPDYVYANEPHVADVGSAPCPDCTNRDEENE